MAVTLVEHVFEAAESRHPSRLASLLSAAFAYDVDRALFPPLAQYALRLSDALPPLAAVNGEDAPFVDLMRRLGRARASPDAPRPLRKIIAAGEDLDFLERKNDISSFSALQVAAFAMLRGIRPRHQAAVVLMAATRESICRSGWRIILCSAPSIFLSTRTTTATCPTRCCGLGPSRG